MIRLEQAGWGVKHGIPTITVAACSMDDVVSITGFGVAFSVAFSKGNLAESLAAPGCCRWSLLGFPYLAPSTSGHSKSLR
ncbi:unnamed protein product [Dibothriocephalus latus]|uniref:Uncharacterized protein n=1 Tax=Dibothriocephalus latus TaxID=60516 RepID=A0A3P7NZZ7_DIBLA|nr:unnamed protein product [Dibothriocephalus latus]